MIFSMTGKICGSAPRSWCAMAAASPSSSLTVMTYDTFHPFPKLPIELRYKIVNAETTEQLATGYTEEKMEVGATSSSVLGVSQSQQGGVSLDTMVQRLIQKTVWEIDNRYK